MFSVVLVVQVTPTFFFFFFLSLLVFFIYIYSWLCSYHGHHGTNFTLRLYARKLKDNLANQLVLQQVCIQSYYAVSVYVWCKDWFERSLILIFIWLILSFRCSLEDLWFWSSLALSFCCSLKDHWFWSSLSPFLIGRMFVREPSWEYSVNLVGS